MAHSCYLPGQPKLMKILKCSCGSRSIVSRMGPVGDFAGHPQLGSKEEIAPSWQPGDHPACYQAVSLCKSRISPQHK